MFAITSLSEHSSGLKILYRASKQTNKRDKNNHEGRSTVVLTLPNAVIHSHSSSCCDPHTKLLRCYCMSVILPLL